MTYREILTYIDTLKPVGIQLGLDRMRQATDLLNQPQNQYPCIHVAGTNGKGSTAHMIAAMLAAAGFKTGLYTSPAVTDLRDTILINGSAVTEEQFTKAAQTVIDRTVCVPLSEFEFVTATMFCIFQQADVDIAVIECGLGGETDATNVIDSTICAVFTPIALDHTSLLGNTVAEIAQKKCGILKPQCGIAYSPDLSEEALDILFQNAAQHGCTLYQCSHAEPIRIDADGTSFVYQDIPVTLSMIGKHQVDNALTALSTLPTLTQHGFPIPLESALQALSAVQLPCRLEIVSRSPLILLDGAHNPQGIERLCQTIHDLNLPPIVLVLGMLSDKDVENSVRRIAPFCRHILCCTPSHLDRALSAFDLADIAKPFHSEISVVSDPIQAFEAAKKAADQSPIVVGGSFYTSSVVRRHLKM